MKHGKTGTRIYRIWKAMKNRCYNPNTPRYCDYGGRGIKICDEWLENPTLFFEWALSNGYQETLSIDRINNDGDYEPSNCRWATMKSQCNNTRRNKYITVNGITKTVAQWAEETGINQYTLYDRLEQGWNEADILSKPYSRRIIGGKSG